MSGADRHAERASLVLQEAQERQRGGGGAPNETMRRAADACLDYHMSLNDRLLGRNPNKAWAARVLQIGSTSIARCVDVDDGDVVVTSDDLRRVADSVISLADQEAGG